MVKPQLQWTKVDSSNVDAVAYDSGSETLCVRFRNGGLYSYSGVNMEIFTSLQYADSVGKYLNKVIKNVFPYQKWEDENAMVDHLSHK